MGGPFPILRSAELKWRQRKILFPRAQAIALAGMGAGGSQCQRIPGHRLRRARGIA